MISTPQFLSFILPLYKAPAHAHRLGKSSHARVVRRPNNHPEISMRRIKRRKLGTISKFAELAVAAPQVVALRTGRMLASGSSPSARDRAEVSRMGTEKVAAFSQSMLAVGKQLAVINQEYTRSVGLRLFRVWMTPWWLAAYPPLTRSIASLPNPARLLAPTRRQQQRAASSLIAKAVAPVHKRATSNAKRLIAKAVAPAPKRTTSKPKRLIAKAVAPVRKRSASSPKKVGRTRKRARS
jgi:hypothetical protein